MSKKLVVGGVYWGDFPGWGVGGGCEQIFIWWGGGGLPPSPQ